MRRNETNFKKNLPIDILTEQLIEDYLETKSNSSTWNTTQLSSIVDSVTAAINTIVHCYVYYPGSAIYLLKILWENNQVESDKKINEEAILGYLYSLGRVKDAPELWQIKTIASRLLRIGSDTLSFTESVLKLHSLQTEDISEEQLKEMHQILDYFTEQAINLLKNSSYYKKAEQEDHLYCDEPPRTIDEKQINLPPTVPENEGKKRKREKPEQSASQKVPTSSEAAFFTPPKRVKKANSDQARLTENPGPHIHR
jgi:hypothetical protein